MSTLPRKSVAMSMAKDELSSAAEHEICCHARSSMVRAIWAWSNVQGPSASGILLVLSQGLGLVIDVPIVGGFLSPSPKQISVGNDFPQELGDVNHWNIYQALLVANDPTLAVEFFCHVLVTCLG